jgi:hypothetical protein
MLEFEHLKTDILELPEEAQEMVVNFVDFLKREYQQSNPSSKSSDLNNQSFIGMWQDRLEMKDSIKWVNQLRRDQWTQTDLIEQIDRRREAMASRVGMMPDSTELLRADRER